MRSSIVLLALPVLFLAACGHREVRETVVEKPIVVPAPAVASASRTCNYSGAVFSSGTLSCQGHSQYVCNNGVWDSTNMGC